MKTNYVKPLIVASAVVLAHVGAHYFFGDPSSFSSAGVTGAGITVFIVAYLADLFTDTMWK